MGIVSDLSQDLEKGWKPSQLAIEFGDNLIDKSKEIIQADPAIGFDDAGNDYGTIDIEWREYIGDFSVAFCVTIWDDNVVDWSMFSLTKTYWNGRGSINNEECIKNILLIFKRYRDIINNLKTKL